MFDGGVDQHPLGNVDESRVEEGHHQQERSEGEGQENHLEERLHCHWERVDRQPDRHPKGQDQEDHKQIFGKKKCQQSCER